MNMQQRVGDFHTSVSWKRSPERRLHLNTRLLWISMSVPALLRLPGFNVGKKKTKTRYLQPPDLQG